MNKIYIYGADKLAIVQNRKAVKQLLISIFEEELVAMGTVTYIFCSDEHLHNINLKFLNHDTLTDVITFPLSEKGKPVEGEVYLSVDRIKENAKSYGVTYQNELLRVMIHGALHLCGYTDKTKAAATKMRNREDFYLNKYNVSREANP